MHPCFFICITSEVEKSKRETKQKINPGTAMPYLIGTTQEGQVRPDWIGTAHERQVRPYQIGTART